jgi:acetylornithine deacetylase/succinyl-diaminopimelate desuccinylase-like protein
MNRPQCSLASFEPPRFQLLLISLALCAAPATAQTRAPEFDYPKLQDEAVGLLQQYLQINTSNPPGNEIQTARFLHDLLSREGIESQILDTLELPAGRANLYARLKGDGSKKAIALVHHMDVVPVSREYWTVDPFAGIIKDGYLYGRGAIDMKSQGIVQLMAFIAIKRAGIALHRDLVFIANADEEDAALGSRTFIARHPDLLQGVEYLITEGEDSRVVNGKVDIWAIDVGEKRTFWRRLTVTGTTVHGSTPLPDNPVVRLAQAVARLGAWQTQLRVLPAVARWFAAEAQFETGSHRAWLADPAAALRDPRGKAWLLSDPERNAFLRNTVTPTGLKGSSQTNVVPPVATADIDIRLLPDQDTLVFRRALLKVIADTSVHLSLLGDDTPPYNAPLDTDLYRVLGQVAREMLPGVPVASRIAVGASDRPYYAKAGILCYGIMPFKLDTDEYDSKVHGNDERISLENVGFGVRYMINTVLEVQ